MTPPLWDLLGRIAAIDTAEAGRVAAIRARFEQRFGHPRGPGLVGAEADFWRAEDLAGPSDTAAADAVGAASIRAYLGAGASDRDALRARFADAPFCRWRLGWAAAAERRGASFPEALDRALAAVELRADGDDARDLIMALDRICLDELGLGHDPFTRIAIAQERARDARGEDTRASRLLTQYLDMARQDALRASVDRRR